MANYDSFIFEGHGISEVTGAYDPGATNGATKENDIADKIVAAAKKYLAPTGLKIHYDENNYSDNDLNGNTYNYNFGISVHVNAGGGQGPEIWVPCKEKTLTSDFELVDQIAKLLKTPNRGVKSREYNGNSYVRSNGTALAYTDYYKEINQAWSKGISLAILEVGFIDTADKDKILARIDELGYLVARYIAGNCNINLTNKKPVAPEEPLYRVTVGGKQICDKTLRKWIPSFIETELKYSPGEIVITRCN